MAKADVDQYKARWQATEKRLRESMECLVKGFPTHPDHQRRSYRLNVSVLAREAGVSRNAIYSNHREVLADLSAAEQRRNAAPKDPGTADSKIADLRAMVDERDRRIQQLVTNNASLLTRALTAEQALTERRLKNAR